jgi:hypothetical protein
MQVQVCVCADMKVCRYAPPLHYNPAPSLPCTTLTQCTSSLFYRCECSPSTLRIAELRTLSRPQESLDYSALSLLPAPCSLLPALCSLLPALCSLLSALTSITALVYGTRRCRYSPQCRCSCPESWRRPPHPLRSSHAQSNETGREC